MTSPPAPWQLTVARIEGALPFIPADLAECLALTSLRRMWHTHVRDYAFDNLGIEHNAGPEAHELMRSWHAEERRQFLSWISRKAPPALARAAQLVLIAKRQSEGFSTSFFAADRALDRLDALLPTHSPEATLLDWLDELRAEEIDFLEGGSELISAAGLPIVRPAPRGAAWAASLAVAARPHVFGLGESPVTLVGVMPRALFSEAPELPLHEALRRSIFQAAEQVHSDLTFLHNWHVTGSRMLHGHYKSASSHRAWRLVLGLAPLTRAELGRALNKTKRTSSAATAHLVQAGLARLREEDGAIVLAAPKYLRG